MLDPTDFGERLEETTNAIAAAGTPAGVLRALLGGFDLASPRTAMFLVRKGALTGWATAGYDASDSERIRGASLPVGSGWPGRLAAPDGPDRAFRSPEDRDDLRDLGAHERRESIACALRVGGRTLAVLLAERDPGERPWSPSAMGILMAMASMRLEVDLARRRLQREAPADEITPPEAPPAVEPETTATALDDDTETGMEAAPVEPETPDAVEPDDPELEAARRFARLIATDIRLYNEEDVLLGRKDGDLQHRMRDHLARGQETFRRRFPSLGDRGVGILHGAYVKVLAGGDADLIDAGEIATDLEGSTS